MLHFLFVLFKCAELHHYVNLFQFDSPGFMAYSGILGLNDMGSVIGLSGASSKYICLSLTHTGCMVTFNSTSLVINE